MPKNVSDRAGHRLRTGTSCGSPVCPGRLADDFNLGCIQLKDSETHSRARQSFYDASIHLLDRGRRVQRSKLTLPTFLTANSASRGLDPLGRLKLMPRPSVPSCFRRSSPTRRSLASRCSVCAKGTRAGTRERDLHIAQNPRFPLRGHSGPGRAYSAWVARQSLDLGRPSCNKLKGEPPRGQRWLISRPIQRAKPGKGAALAHRAPPSPARMQAEQAV